MLMCMDIEVCIIYGFIFTPMEAYHSFMYIEYACHKHMDSTPSFFNLTINLRGCSNSVDVELPHF